MLTNFFCPVIDDMHVSDMMLQQGSATCQTASITLNLLQNNFLKSARFAGTFSSRALRAARKFERT